ncbi:MAG: peptidoglycan D,D-transpeptidase FtsI family protein [Pseudomonadales bacterium]
MKPRASSAVTSGTQALRYQVVLIILAVLLGLLVLRLLNLQVLQGDKDYRYLQQAGDARSVRTVVNTAHRGMITDRNGRPLAISTPVTSIWLNPQQFSLSSAAILAEQLGMSAAQLTAKIERNNSKEFLYVKRQLAPQRAEKVLDLKIVGVHSQTEYKRFYPAAEVSAHLLGFTDVDQKGVDGLEWTYDSLLRGQSGSKRVLKSLDGKVIKNIDSVVDVSHGDDLQLSIDLRLQYYAYKELKAAVEKFGARSGSVVILDTQTNEILAMVNEPSYNPNKRAGLTNDDIRNRAITDVFEPGSTMKPLTMIGALESDYYQHDTQIDTSPGYINVEGKLIADIKNYGSLDIGGILKKSSQVGTSLVALQLGGSTIREVMQRFGLGQSLATGFPGESFGSLPNYAKWHPLHTVTMAYGYGVATTPLQLAQVYSVLANRGLRKDVSLIRSSDEAYSERVVDETIARQVAGMLTHTTEQGGTGTRAQIDGYSVAGKTGTLHRLGKKGYEGSNYVSVFAGFAPANAPRLAAAVVIDDPRAGSYYGGEVAAPVFSRVVGESLRLLNVLPDEIQIAEVM